MSTNSKTQFLTAVLGKDGAKAVSKAFTKTPSLEYFLVPRTVLSWVKMHKTYEGSIPGIDNSYIRLEKTDKGWNGVVTQPAGPLVFSGDDIYSVSAHISIALGYEEGVFEGSDKDLYRVGKNIDALVKTTELTKNFAKAWPKDRAQNTQNAGGFVGQTAAHAVARDQLETQTGAPMGIVNQTVIPSRGPNSYETPAGIPFRPGLGEVAPIARNQHGHPIVATNVPCRGCGAPVANPHIVGQFCDTCNEKQTLAEPGLYQARIDQDLYPEGWGDQPAPNLYNPSEAAMGRAGIESGYVEQHGPVDNSDIFDKTELPGQTAQPRQQVGPVQPQVPTKQPKIPNKPKLPKLSTLKTEKSVDTIKCSTCELPMFKNSKFTGCVCFKELAKSTKTTAYSDGYVLEFNQNAPARSVSLLRQELADAIR